ncbi:MAG: hypothetical protein F6J98_25860 [Moorea sp. SIO4G2]|uniref:Uncharacterized protein n=1 Tax=Moorena bouillonii PNG TaxID=568701 RepID=A0A1U7MXK5_9CYAN|nr:hypothetical protein [Moorena bouillonii]NEO63670.1 hypothetical protein [Moorena sp. SIO4G2]OLT58433.1 hypothetical protein BJP37_04605 [Moorena bouillonii PNG]OLT58435.1 hypothetical protein BJP37_04615 [Moorena bouillonii PNG]
MDNQLSFIIKLVILSTIISVIIKYVAPSVPIAATSVNGLIGILAPTVILAIALVGRALSYGKSN